MLFEVSSQPPLNFLNGLHLPNQAIIEVAIATKEGLLIFNKLDILSDVCVIWILYIHFFEHLQLFR